MMALTSALVSPPSLLLSGSKAHSRILPSYQVPKITVRQRSLTIVVKAVGDGSDSSSGSIVKFVQNAWSSSEDRIALIGLGFAGVTAIWASNSLITAIDKLPVIPGFLEFVGILFSWWFIYRYLLFKPDREEFFRNVKKSVSDVLGQ